MAESGSPTALDESVDAALPDAALPDAAQPGHTGIETLLAQLEDDDKLYARELVEVLFHCQAVKSSADYRILQAAILIYEEREQDYLRRIDAEIGTGEVTIPQACTDPDVIARMLVGDRDPIARFGPDGMSQAVCEIGAALTVTPAQARRLIETGAAMRYRLPKTATALASGRIDLPRFTEIVARTDMVADEHATPLDEALATEILSREPMSMSRFRTMVDATITKVDPEAVGRRREATTAKRHIRIRPDREEPGHSRITGLLPAPQAAILDARLDEMIVHLHRSDPRSTSQQRADALIALASGHHRLRCECGDCAGRPCDTPTAANQPPVSDHHPESDDPRLPDEPAGDSSADNTIVSESPRLASPPCDHRPRPHFHIVVNLSTLLGADSDPALLDGHGLIDADTARSLLAEARRTYIHPPGAVAESDDDPAAEKYPIPSRLRELVLAGEISCSFPGCTKKARRTDLDHGNPFNHANPGAGGKTESTNLKPLCRFHHRHKTFATGWRDHQTPMGAVFFISPEGYIFAGNAYTGRDLFPALHPPRPHSDERIPQRFGRTISSPEPPEPPGHPDGPAVTPTRGQPRRAHSRAPTSVIDDVPPPF